MHMVWGVIRRRTVLLAVTVEPDGFTVSGSPDDAGFVSAGDIVGIQRGERHLGSGYVLRVEHAAAGVPSPVGLVLKRGHPVRAAVEALRPELVTGAMPPPWWRSVFTIAVAVVVLIVALGLVLF
ncbi:hypothetical protein [Actinophytocola sp. NPDC049390]|uniref:hypothetical protein n=1 Tax=Actinophytocola sp. NPDC049390 TaxID=3363894 RepID=UPI00379C9DCF